jgi:hypothetical protein
MISSASPSALSAPQLPRWTLPRAPLLPTKTPLAPLSLRPRPRTKARTSACRWPVAFEGVCVGALADGAGQRGDNDDDVESTAGEVGHEDHGPHRFDRRGRGNHHCHYCRCRSCRRRRFPLSGGRGGVRRGRCLSVVIGGGAVLAPAAKRALLDRRTVPPRPLRSGRSISPSLSSCLCPPH